MQRMATAAQLDFADRAGRFYVRQYGFAPVTGRLLGYLAVCDPQAQTIADLAEALRASRSAITGSVKQLEGLGTVQRTRAAGDRVDRAFRHQPGRAGAEGLRPGSVPAAGGAGPRGARPADGRAAGAARRAGRGRRAQRLSRPAAAGAPGRVARRARGR